MVTKDLFGPPNMASHTNSQSLSRYSNTTRAGCLKLRPGEKGRVISQPNPNNADSLDSTRAWKILLKWDTSINCLFDAEAKGS